MKNEKKKPSSKGRKILFISLFVLLAAGAAVTAVLFTGGQKALAGVSVNGIDISGMTREQALEATKGVPEELLGGITLSINFGGDIREFTASQLGITTDYEEVIDQAIAYGNTGTAEEKRQAEETAKNEGKDFKVSVRAEKSSVLAALAPVKEEYDKQAEESGFTFMPWGYLPDGTPYTPDKESIIKAAARGVKLDRPALTRLREQDMPNPLRYQYWNETYYVKDYIPADADIARFLYTGMIFDMDAVADSVVNAVETGDYATITAHGTIPEDLKKNTQLISSWTSSYREHFNYNRNWNVAKLSGIINGVVIQPGETWSINEEAGPRTSSGGWLDAPGIRNGGYVDEPGGGVCQISSTLYNAAIRANLDIVDASHHSISSSYIPLGLDATISTPSPDLKIRNPYDTPIYIVSYVNPTRYNVTVEIYGPPVVDPELGEVILDFSFKDGGTFGSPTMRYVYNTSKAPDGKVIPPGKSYTYAQSRLGRKVETFKHYLSLDGKELKKESFHSYKWNPFNGITYVNGSEKPTPTPEKTPKTTPKPTLKPTQAATATPHSTPASPSPSATTAPAGSPEP